MVLFSYSAQSRDGQLVQGTLDAVNRSTARVILEDMQLRVTTLQEIPQENVGVSSSGEQPPPTTESLEPAPWTTVDDPSQPAVTPPPPPPPTQDAEPNHPQNQPTPTAYFPLVDTLRLYAGWLLAGYFVAYALGSYQLTKPLPFQIPYVLAFVYSPLIRSFSLAAFLFLFATSIRRLLPKGTLLSLLTSIVTIALFLLYLANT
ncbi:hypothetical protein COU80_04215 [Candidatus Peregrinibacteria bacterium CG10_big_fil_rev_8_21_14_0_10_55_24]|nr:MAG: hypothetical protein COU80_04215 [Candidatus Peregrinibacteria bacterium CG10_big_fil_rev_8_21_14_0_10_55_24]